MDKDFGFCKDAVNHFREKYTPEAIKSIADLSSDITMSKKTGFDSFNLESAVNDFREFIEGYVDYKGKHSGDSDQLSSDTILEKSSNMINETLFTYGKTNFSEAMNFIEGYLEALDNINKFIQEKIKQLNESSGDAEHVGTMMKTFDKFIEKMELSMDNTMGNLLHCSGYKVRRSEDLAKNNNDFFL